MFAHHFLSVGILMRPRGDEHLMYEDTESLWVRMVEIKSTAGSLLNMALRVHWGNLLRSKPASDRKYTRLVHASVVESEWHLKVALRMTLALHLFRCSRSEL